MFPFFMALVAFSAFSGCGSDVAVQMDDGTYVFSEDEWNSEESYDNGDGWNESDAWANEESQETSEESYTVTEETETTGTFTTEETVETVETEEPETVQETHESWSASGTYELDMSLLNTVQDYGPDGMAKGFEAKPFFHMLSYIAHMTNTQCESIDFEEAYVHDMLASPSRFRGMPVSVWGKVVWLDEKTVPNAGKYAGAPSTLFHGLLMDDDGGFCYFLTMDPPVWLTNEREVWVHGFFFRNYAYRTKSGKMQSTPVVMVKYFEED
jgi:hypothetical protein